MSPFCEGLCFSTFLFIDLVYYIYLYSTLLIWYCRGRIVQLSAEVGNIAQIKEKELMKDIKWNGCTVESNHGAYRAGGLFPSATVAWSGKSGVKAVRVGESTHIKRRASH